jgi:RNA polymerase sigma-70 factor (ECF subfamily)
MNQSADETTADDGDSRDRELFLELLAMHEAQLLGFLCAIVRNFQDAEDIFQQSVLTMWQKFGEFTPGSNFVGWGCRIGRNHAMNLMSGKREVALSDDIVELLAVDQADEEPELRHARRRALATCIEKLSAKDRELVRAAYANRATVKTIADQFGRSVGGVYNSLSRIRTALFRCIQSKVSQEGWS